MPWINHLPPVCWSTFGILVWNDSGYVNLTQWWYFFIIFEYILHISTPHIMIFCFPLPYFPLSQQVLYFLLSTLVLTLYIDVVLSLSICSKVIPSYMKLAENMVSDLHHTATTYFRVGITSLRKQIMASFIGKCMPYNNTGFVSRYGHSNWNKNVLSFNSRLEKTNYNLSKFKIAVEVITPCGIYTYLIAVELLNGMPSTVLNSSLYIPIFMTNGSSMMRT